MTIERFVKIEEKDVDYFSQTQVGKRVLANLGKETWILLAKSR